MRRIFSFFNRHNPLTWLIVIGISVFIFYISSLPFPPNPIKQKPEIIPTAYHIIIFLLLSFFLILALSKKQLNRNILILVILISIWYALSDEFHQIFVPNRTFAVSDLLLDSSGSFLGILIFLFSRKIKKGKLKQ